LPSGAIVERARLRCADGKISCSFARRISRRFPNRGRVNQRFGSPVAVAENSGLIQVNLPADYSARSIDFIAELEKITVDADRRRV